MLLRLIRTDDVQSRGPLCARQPVSRTQDVRTLYAACRMFTSVTDSLDPLLPHDGLPPANRKSSTSGSSLARAHARFCVGPQRNNMVAIYSLDVTLAGNS